MKRNKFIAAVIASTMMISMALTGCGGKTTTAPAGDTAVGEKTETKKKDNKITW